MKGESKMKVRNTLNCILKVIAGILISFYLLIILLLIMILYSCNYHGFGGERTDLYAVAVNNVFGINGYESNGEAIYDPTIEVIETDEYGRTLFLYDEFYYGDIGFERAFVIMQKAENGYAYYYQDDCYAPCFETEQDFEKLMDQVDPSIIEELKERNDWNREINESKCTTAKIKKKKPEGKIGISESTVDSAIYKYAKANGYTGTDERTTMLMRYCNSDSSGSELYYVYCMSMDDDGQGGIIYEPHFYAVIVSPNKMIYDGAIAEITDVEEYYEIINDLKERNGWK